MDGRGTSGRQGHGRTGIETGVEGGHVSFDS